MASILYVATDQGVVTLKSADGHNWKQEHHGLKDWQVPEVAVSPQAPNKVFAGHPRRRRLAERGFRRDLEKALLRQARPRQSALPDLRSP